MCQYPDRQKSSKTRLNTENKHFSSVLTRVGENRRVDTENFDLRNSKTSKSFTTIISGPINDKIP
jgi:hypothetical protein